MRGLVFAGAVASAVCMAPAAIAAQVTFDELQGMVAGMGYTTKPLPPAEGGPATKFEFTVVTSEFNVPMGLEVSKSGRYIWCTASLGEFKKGGDAALELLKQNASLQPTSFWLTSKGFLMIGIAIDNREVTPEHLRFVFDKLAADVGKSAAVWNAG